MIDRAGLTIADPLARFVEDDVLPPLGIAADGFWAGVANIFARFAPENRALLQVALNAPQAVEMVREGCTDRRGTA